MKKIVCLSCFSKLGDDICGLRKVLLFMVLVVIGLGFVLATNSPLIEFVDPTPNDGTNTTNTSIEINVSITESDLGEMKFNWNSVNYTFYDDNLVLMMNFDNVSALGENDTYAVDVSKYGNNGTLYGNTTWNSTGKYGGAYEFDGDGDYVGVVGLTETTATINVSSASVQEVFNIGDEKKFDVSEDNYYDIYVRLNSIFDDRANLTIGSIYEEVFVEEKVVEAEEIGEVEEVELWLVVLGLVVLVLVVVLVVGYKKKKR
jgi:hypothetical protein